MKKFLLGLSLCAASLAANSAFAAAETYVINNPHTFPRFEYNHLGFSNQSGRFDKTSGKIILDMAAKKGSLDITIDAKSISMGDPLFNEHLSKEDFFSTAKYPTITFKSSNLKFEDNRVASVEGDLTIKGITKPVTLTINNFHCGVNPLMKKQACGANATATIKRSEFNMGKYVPAVSDEVKLSISVEAVKE